MNWKLLTKAFVAQAVFALALSAQTTEPAAPDKTPATAPAQGPVQGDTKPQDESKTQGTTPQDEAAKLLAQEEAARVAARAKLLEEARRRVPKFKTDEFEAWLAKRGAKPDLLETFRTEWKEGPDARITNRALRAVDTKYDKALALVEDGKPEGVLELTKYIALSEDPVARAHARYYLGRALLDEDDPEGAAMLLSDFILEDRGRTTLDGEAAFYYAYSLSLIPDVQLAIVNLKAFLELYPNSSERYRANAQQLLQELEAQWQSPLHALADEMKGAERKLRKERFGEPLQVQQLDIVEKLAKLIEEMEKQQQGGGGSPSGNQIPGGPAGNSALPGGEGRIGKLHGSRGVKDRWGSMKDKDRAKILSELQTKLPERYRVLLENYYKRVNSGGK